MSHRHTVTDMADRHTQGDATTVVDEQPLTVQQVATEWGVSVRTIQRYIEQGRLQATRLPGGHSRISRAAIDDAIAQASK